VNEGLERARLFCLATQEAWLVLFGTRHEAGTRCATERVGDGGKPLEAFILLLWAMERAACLELKVSQILFTVRDVTGG
jgi:hypothetical protein